jgi:glutamyl/glutaminyl-tRNA synthetase
MSPNTALQVQMFEALGARRPPSRTRRLLVGSEGKLSKRLGSLGVDAMREEGIEPLALAGQAGADRHQPAGRAGDGRRRR